MLRTLWWVALAATLAGSCLLVSAAEPSQNVADEVTVPKLAVAVLHPTQGNDARGVIQFDQQDGFVRLYGRVTRLTPGKHGFHIHDYGDLTAADGTSAGGHFAPFDKQHGSPDSPEHHYGDLGNIVADERGVADVDIKADWMKLHFIIGRAMVVHADADDFAPPTGHAGARVTVGVIGIANPKDQAASP